MLNRNCLRRDHWEPFFVLLSGLNTFTDYYVHFKLMMFIAVAYILYVSQTAICILFFSG